MEGAANHFFKFFVLLLFSFAMLLIGKNLDLVPLLRDEEAGHISFCLANPAKSALDDIVARVLLVLLL